MKIFKSGVYLLPAFIILIIFIFQFVVNPKYTFPEPHVFKGDFIYNPYEGINGKWKIANFHAHTRILLGLTNGSANKNKSLDAFYRYFSYNIIGISNYQSINKFQVKNSWFIPIYEHGYQYYKTHQLVINSRKVSWLDYLFRQTLDNKQYIIDHLKRDTSAVITIVHPGRNKAYKYSDFKYLGNYDFLEIANNHNLYTSYYDTILSSGHPVFLVADDDSHNLAKLNDGCQSFNLICTGLAKDSILNAMKKGCMIGVNVKPGCFLTEEEKRTALQHLPSITSVAIKDDTLKISLDQAVKTIRFIGQQGVERSIITNSAEGSYFFSKQDTYIRTEIECQNGTIYFLNPVFRYDGVKIKDQAPVFNLTRTRIWRIVTLCLLLSFVLVRIRQKYNGLPSPQ